MKKYLCLFLCACLLLPLLAGCQNDEEATTTQPTDTQPSVLVPPTTLTEGSEPEDNILDGYNIPTIDENYWELLCDNCDFTAYLKSGGQKFLGFELISAQDLEGESITILSDLGGTATYTIPPESHDPVPLSRLVFLTYQDVDWAAFEGDYTAMNEQLAEMEDAWLVAQEILPKLYSYLFLIPYDDLGVEPKKGENGQYPSWEDVGELAPQQIKTLSVTIGEKTKTYELDNLLFLAEKAAENTGYWGGLTLNGIMAASDYPADPTADGTVELPDLRYAVKADVVLQSFTVPGAEVMGCDLKITTPLGDTFKLQWDCKTPIEVDEGSEILLENVIYLDPSFAGKLQGNVLRYASMNYTNNGELFQCLFQVNSRLRCDPWDAYAWYMDGVDMMPYYLEFKNYGK